MSRFDHVWREPRTLDPQMSCVYPDGSDLVLPGDDEDRITYVRFLCVDSTQSYVSGYYLRRLWFAEVIGDDDLVLPIRRRRLGHGNRFALGVFEEIGATAGNK